MVEDCHHWDVTDLRDLLALCFVVLLGLDFQINDEIAGFLLQLAQNVIRWQFFALGSAASLQP